MVRTNFGSAGSIHLTGPGTTMYYYNIPYTISQLNFILFVLVFFLTKTIQNRFTSPDISMDGPLEGKTSFNYNAHSFQNPTRK